MKLLLILICVLSCNAWAQTITSGENAPWDEPSKVDWLVNTVSQSVQITKSKGGKEIILYNGLVKRVFNLRSNVACIEYKNLSNGQQLIRAIKAEARLTINGKNYNVGGLYGQKENAYLLKEWVDDLISRPADFQFKSYSVSDVLPYVIWKPATWATNKSQPKGKVISFDYEAGADELKGLQVVVHYEVYDGLPLIVKWLSIVNKSDKTFKLDTVVNEILGVVEEESAVVGNPELMKKQHGIYFESNYAFNNAMRYDISDQTLHWKTDSTYTSQVNYNYKTPCLVEVYPQNAPGIRLQPGEIFNSIRTYELLIDSYDRERRGLAIRKMYRTIAPWTTANPIFMHLVSRNDEQVLTAIDQCAATGYEAVILSFGSHLNMEDSSASNILNWRKLADYAHSKNVLIGGYSLFSSRKISDEDDVIDPRTGKPGGAFFGNAPCFGSKWGLAYRDKIKFFFEKTGFDIWENDGPYPGDICASVKHPGHTGMADSQWKQMTIQKSLYKWLNERGVYINAPDWYFLDGTHKIGIGYRETNFSLPRDQQKILNRQNIFDGTWEKTASMSWGFVPLTKYQGGGPDAVLEPLNDHLKDYEQLMMQYYGAGVQACYRGPRLYDTESTKRTVIKVINWYKQHRDILNADLIHLKRASGSDWDGWLHVNASLKEKGLLMIFNPTRLAIIRTISVPLYYTGLTNEARISEQQGPLINYRLDREFKVELKINLPAGSYSWWVIE